MIAKRKIHDENPFTYELTSGEHLLWTGRPDPGKIFSAQDIFQIPFSLLWGGFALFWNLMVWAGSAPIFFRLWGLPFLFMGIYMIVGRFIYKAWRKRGTYYAVTDKRLMILSMGLRYNLQAFPIDQLPTLKKQVNRAGAGSVIFGEPPKQSRLAAQTHEYVEHRHGMGGLRAGRFLRHPRCERGLRPHQRTTLRPAGEIKATPA